MAIACHNSTPEVGSGCLAVFLAWTPCGVSQADVRTKPRAPLAFGASQTTQSGQTTGVHSDEPGKPTPGPGAVIDDGQAEQRRLDRIMKICNGC